MDVCRAPFAGITVSHSEGDSAEPRIPSALQEVYLQANAELPLLPPEKGNAHQPLNNTGSVHNKGPAPHRRHRQRSVKHKQAPVQQPRKANIPRTVTFTAAEASAASVKTRQLQLALEGCSMKDKSPGSSSAVVTPLEYLNTILFERGYSSKTYSTLDTGFVNPPSELQQASYHIYMAGLVAKNDVATFQQVMLSGLVAPNPCNRFGESILHMVCRRGRCDMLHVMLQAGASIHVIDDFGRTPLVDACWASEPAFDVVKVLLDIDARLVNMCDLRGAPPLSYIPKKDYRAWIMFLDSVKDTYWPYRGVSPPPQSTPPICLEAPRSRPIPQPRLAGVTCEIASLVASGQLSPKDALAKLSSLSSSSSCDDTEERSMQATIHTDEEGATVSDESDYSDDDEEDTDDDDDSSICSAEVQKIFADLQHHNMPFRNCN